ncbi:hypothetical protein JW906_10510 [bacterium]|nr:hypothetical protein [bacterium]
MVNLSPLRGLRGDPPHVHVLCAGEKRISLICVFSERHALKTRTDPIEQIGIQNDLVGQPG